MKVALAGIIGGHGGVQTHLRWLSTALTEAGHQVSIISLDKHVPEQEQSVESPAVQRSTSVIHLPNSGRWSTRIKRPIMIIDHLRKFKPDFYIACGGGTNVFLPAFVSRCGARLVFFEVTSGLAIGWNDARWIAAHFFDTVVGQAYPVAENFKKSFGYAGDITVLPAFPEPLERSAYLPKLNSGDCHSNGSIKAAMFGRLVPHKRALWLVQQWPRFRESISELHIFGSGEEEDPIREWIAAHGMQKEVHCHGVYPSGQGYVDLISSFNLTLLPTIGDEGAPLVLLESMACGVPFVACDTGGISDYKNPDCILCGTEPNNFIRAVQAMVGQIKSGQIDRRRLQQFYLHDFSFQALSYRWCEWLQQVGQRCSASVAIQKSPRLNPSV